MRLSAESVYEALIDEEDARACADISESACRETPRSFVLILVSQLFAGWIRRFARRKWFWVPNITVRTGPFRAGIRRADARFHAGPGR